MYHMIIFYFKKKTTIKIMDTQYNTPNKYGDCGAIIFL